LYFKKGNKSTSDSLPLSLTIIHSPVHYWWILGFHYIDKRSFETYSSLQQTFCSRILKRPSLHYCRMNSLYDDGDGNIIYRRSNWPCVRVCVIKTGFSGCDSVRRSENFHIVVISSLLEVAKTQMLLCH